MKTLYQLLYRSVSFDILRIKTLQLVALDEVIVFLIAEGRTITSEFIRLGSVSIDSGSAAYSRCRF